MYYLQSSMNSLMFSQIALLAEPFIAAFKVAYVGFLSSMDSQMVLQRLGFVKALSASIHSTSVGFLLSRMVSGMGLQPPWLVEGLSATGGSTNIRSWRAIVVIFRTQFLTFLRGERGTNIVVIVVVAACAHSFLGCLAKI